MNKPRIRTAALLGGVLALGPTAAFAATPSPSGSGSVSGSASSSVETAPAKPAAPAAPAAPSAQPTETKKDDGYAHKHDGAKPAGAPKTGFGSTADSGTDASVLALGAAAVAGGLLLVGTGVARARRHGA